VEEQDSATQPPRGELQPGERINRTQVGVDERAHIADDHLGIAALQQRAQVFAERLDLGARYRIAEDQDDHARLGGRGERDHRCRRRLLGSGHARASFRAFQVRRLGRPKLIALPPDAGRDVLA